MSLTSLADDLRPLDGELEAPRGCRLQQHLILEEKPLLVDDVLFLLDFFSMSRGY